MSNTLLESNTYERLGITEIEQVLAAILAPKIKNISLFGQQVGVTSLRLQTFAIKGIVCSCCGLTASHFAVERNRILSPKSYHLNLYGIKDGKEILFTRDHVIPRAAGGLDVLSNLVTMCWPCNNEKGCRLPAEAEAVPAYS